MVFFVAKANIINLCSGGPRRRVSKPGMETRKRDWFFNSPE
ncbi:hypothetical protein DCCM_3665 [Desulfocucumis palustris]|uniref:Uncharacterized protein n=1 Tax=Desulfocucumis palustris TaxID=1898651 RepID=A0A2L2XJV0_9FIRM|nr:hypothetical protein DCCM_3665 [Desulfocucumis palustris]